MREGQLPCARKASMLTGGYHLLLQFSISVGKRVPDMPLYALFLIPMLAVFALLMIETLVWAWRYKRLMYCPK